MPPAVNRVRFGSSSTEIFGAGATISVQVRFDVPVTVTGSPQLALAIGGSTRQAAYVGGSGTQSLTFEYVVQSADRDTDGISIGGAALSLNGGAIQSAAGANAALALGTYAISNFRYARVDGSTIMAPSVNAVTLVSTPASGNTYGAGERIEAQIGFDIAVDVTGTPQLALGVGARTRQAAYLSGSGTKTLVFGYTVQSADMDANGISVAANALTLNGGVVAGRLGAAARLDLGSRALRDEGSHRVNGSTAPVPEVSALTLNTPVSAGMYGASERIEVEVGFNMPVRVTGTPRLALGVGSGLRQAAYLSGSGTKTLVFGYVVLAPDQDSDGISVGVSALSLNGGTIQSAVGVNAALALGNYVISNSDGHKVDGSTPTTPSVCAVTLASTPASGATYGAGERIEAQIGFDIAVDVRGAPRLALGIGSGAAQADYASGSGTRTLTFRYETLATDQDANGISIGAAALSLNGGGIQSNTGTDANLNLGTHTITNSSGHKVNGTRTVPVVNSVSIISDSRGIEYPRQAVISVDVGFQIAVTVTGAPRLALTIGSSTRQAAYAGGSGTRTLTFKYSVQSTDTDANGISIGGNALTLNSGTIQSATGINAALALGSHAIDNATAHKVYGLTSPTGPTTLRIASRPASGSTYAAGEVIVADVIFGSRITVAGTPQLALTIGNATRQANFFTRGPYQASFRYRVQAVDLDANGISIGGNALSLNGGRIYDRVGDSPLDLSGLALTNVTGHKVNGPATAPAVNTLNFAAGPLSGNTYGAGETIEVRVGFQIPVTVTGAPYVALGIGSSTKQAVYAHGSGTNTLTFHYLVQAADSDLNGITVGTSALSLNSGTIQSGAGTNALLTLGSHAVTNSSGHKVNGSTTTAPSVTGASLTSSPAAGDIYGADERIDVGVVFDLPVTVTGTPRLALSIGGGTRQAAYLGGSGTKTLTFSYYVHFLDRDTNGVGVGASALSLAGGTIRSNLGANAALALGRHAIGDASGHKVNGGLTTAATVTGVTIASSPASGDTYGAGEAISVRVGYQVGVTVTGTPRLWLGIGARVRQAAYAGGSGTNALTFTYTVAATDSDDNGISIGANALSLDGGTIQTGVGLTASLALASHVITNNGNHKVNGPATAPAVVGLSVASTPASGDTYGAGERIEVEVGFQIPVTVTRTPRLALTVGAQTRQAAHVSGSGTKTLTFRYVVQSADRDANGISIGGNALSLNGGTIRSAAGTNALRALGGHAISNSTGHKVNGSTAPAPSVNAVKLASTPASGDTYGAGERIEVEVGFNIPVNVGGTPQLALRIGAHTRQMAYLPDSPSVFPYHHLVQQSLAASRRGLKTLTFDYYVQSSDVDADGISIEAGALSLNGGTIRSSAGTNAALALGGSHVIANDGNHKVNGPATAPAVADLSIASSPASGDTYGAGERIEVEGGVPDSGYGDGDAASGADGRGADPPSRARQRQRHEEADVPLRSAAGRPGRQRHQHRRQRPVAERRDDPERGRDERAAGAGHLGVRELQRPQG